MSDLADLAPEELYAAYLTTDMSDGLRTPIAGERIVIVLGKDQAGRPLELSVLLKKSAQPGRLTFYSINEPISDASTRGGFPRPVVEACPVVNVFQVSIQYEPIDSDEAGAEMKTSATAAEPRKGSGARCSFCRMPQSDVGPVVEGPGPERKGGVFICRACCDLCVDIIEQEKRW